MFSRSRAGRRRSFQQAYWAETNSAEHDAEAIEALLRGEAALVGGMGLADAVLDALQDAGDADLDELVEIAGGDGEELDALEQGIALVLSLFEDAAVEAEPGVVAIEEELLGRCGRGGMVAVAGGGAGCGGASCSFDGHSAWEKSTAPA